MGNERNQEGERKWERRERRNVYIHLYHTELPVPSMDTQVCHVTLYPNVCNTLLTTHYGLLMCDEMFTTRRRKYLIIGELVTFKWLSAKIKLH